MNDTVLNSPRESLGALSTPTISDALDRLGVSGAASGLRPVETRMRMVGRAFTVRYVPVGPEVVASGDWLDDVSNGQVAVIDNSGRTDVTVWGDIMTTVAHSRSLAGTVINGVCRDSDTCAELNYPVFSAGTYMRTGKDRIQLAETGGVVNLAGVLVRPDDWLVGDRDGIVVVHQEVVEDVLRIGAEIVAKEKVILGHALDSGSLVQARERYGYHVLQRQESTGG
jgi:regulator of RNase E activity RraA